MAARSQKTRTSTPITAPEKSTRKSPSSTSDKSPKSMSAISSRSAKTARGAALTTGGTSKTAKPSTPRLLSGGNPQIAKGSGDAPVQAYIAAMPGWKSDVGRKLDALIVRTVPGVSKAVKWNSPLYGVEGDGWFLGVHVFAKYIKVAFFRGASLRPVPPGTSKQKEVRYLDVREGEWGSAIAEAQVAEWVKQASRLPGERM